MKKTINTNLNGLPFIIDEDAYELLSEYLKRIEGYFDSSESKKEIMSDIEARIAELLYQRNSDKKQIVVSQDIEHVISIMGKPEEYSQNGETENHEKPNFSRENTHSSKKFGGLFGKSIYRDGDHRVLGGVCSGLGHYFGVDRVWIRLLFIFLFFTGVWPLLYLIMWIVIPKAHSSSEKLEMRGEPVDFSNIGKTVQDEMKELKNKYANYKYEYTHNKNNWKQEWKQEVKEASHSIADSFGRIFRGIGGVFFLFLGIILLTALIGSYFWDTNFIHIDDVTLNADQSKYMSSYLFSDPAHIKMMWIGVYGLIATLGTLFLFWAIKLLFNIRTRTKWISVFLFILSVGFFIFLLTPLLMLKNEFQAKNELEIVQPLKSNQQKTLYIAFSPAGDYGKKLNGRINNYELIEHESQYKLGVVPSLKIIQSIDTAPQIKMIKISRGNGKISALENTKNLQYTYYQSNDTLFLDSYGILNPTFRKQKLNIELRVPQGYKVIYDKKTQDIFAVDIEQEIATENEKLEYTF